MKKYFDQTYFQTFEQGLEREWIISNGIGGYASLSITGGNARHHHGLLVASLHPPVERMMILQRINECIRFDDEKEVDFSVFEKHDGVCKEGQKHQTSFSYDGIPCFIYQANGFKMEKRISFLHGKNQVGIEYLIENESNQGVFHLTPCFQYRDHGESSTMETLQFATGYEEHRIWLIPQDNQQAVIWLESSAGEIIDRKEQYMEDLIFYTDMKYGGDKADTCFTPYEICVPIKKGERKRISILAGISIKGNEAIGVIPDKIEEDTVSKMIQEEYERIHNLYKNAGLPGDFANALVRAADQFIVERESTGYKTILAGFPWFTDWGRDTMIAMQGLCLSTGRLEDARGILKTFAMYVKHGLVPNMFPDEGAAPLYNTVDASLWYFYSVQKYLEVDTSLEAYNFVHKELFPVLVEIGKAYENGTDFSIYQDTDGLIHAGSDLDQVTWMDVRVGELVVTPRHGKPVEINALWYNALCFMTELSQKYGEMEQAKRYKQMATKTKKAFLEKFWNPDKNCLFDVVEEETKQGIRNNEQIRPNQIWAVSLPFTMLSEEQEKLVVDRVYKDLYGVYGLRSLAPDDPDYRGLYYGALMERDLSYHQGTVWAFPLGGFLLAYSKVYGRNNTKEFFEPLKEQLSEGCIDQIAEIFDGDEPHISRGCFGQAWSVGEILWAYQQIVLQ